MTLLDWIEPDADVFHGDHHGPDYNHGYAHGKEKAHWEIREVARDETSHAPSCGCEPCQTLLVAAMSFTYEAAYDTVLDMRPEAVTVEQWVPVTMEIATRCSTADTVIEMLAHGHEGMAIALAANLAWQEAAPRVSRDTPDGAHVSDADLAAKYGATITPGREGQA